jgi:FkbM family methyltransferase
MFIFPKALKANSPVSKGCKLIIKKHIRNFLKTREIVNSVSDYYRFFLKSQDPYEISKFRYDRFSFFARRFDWLAVEEVLIDEEYQLPLKSLSNASETPVILDCGANIGCFALYAFKMHPRAKIISIEPSQSTCAVLSNTRKLNPHLEWFVENSALARECEELRLYHAGASTGHRLGAKGDNFEVVNCVTVDHVIEKYELNEIDLLKMDIEGAEDQVICSSPGFLDRVKVLVIEVHNDRIDDSNVMAILRDKYDKIDAVPNRKSQKPLYIATRKAT